MTSHFALTAATSLCALMLMQGPAFAKEIDKKASAPSSIRQTNAPLAKKVSPPASSQERGGRSTAVNSAPSKSAPVKAAAAPKQSPIKAVEKIAQHRPAKSVVVEKSQTTKLPIVSKAVLPQKAASKVVAIGPVAATGKVIKAPAASMPPVSLKTTAVLAGAAVATVAAAQTKMKLVPTAPVADSHKRISSAALGQFVKSNVEQHNAQTFSPADGAKHKAAIQQVARLIADPMKGYQVAVYGEKNYPAAKPQGDNSTIVINENNKTVYVPASTVSGPDHRTIIVNCHNCKVVIVGDTSVNGQPVVDERKIVVNGSGDKIVLQGDKANGGASQDGGSVTDSRKVTVSGDGNQVKLDGDSVNGGRGANNGAGRGQDGGNGGTLTDNRKVTVTSDGENNKIAMGGDSANGGRGGNGPTNGGNGGAGGDLTDHRKVDNQGENTKVKTGTDQANGGNGGNGETSP